MLTSNQIKIIHTAIANLGLKDFEYRNILSNFNVQSSKDLSYEQFKELMKIFKKIGFKKETKNLNRKRYNDLGIRYNENLQEHYATPKQLRMIEALWMSSNKVYNKNIDALTKFVKRISGKDRLDWLMMNDVHKVIKAIKSL